MRWRWARSSKSACGRGGSLRAPNLTRNRTSASGRTLRAVHVSRRQRSSARPTSHGLRGRAARQVAAGHGVGAALPMAEARTMFLAERLVASSRPATSGKRNAAWHGQDRPIHRDQVILDAGDIVVFYTDGLTEAAN